LAADNALAVQSTEHPDGWGVAYYVDGVPHVARSPLTALGDSLFHRLSGVVSSETVLAHVRRATHGGKSVLNCHPFQYGRWVFAHNGDIPGFEHQREALLELVSPRLRRFILGETDSELIFSVFLTELSGYGPLSRRHSIDDVAAALRSTMQRVREVSDANGSEKPAELTAIVTDGETLCATEGGKELFVSTYKTRCSDRNTCPSLAPECEAPSASGFVNHLILSSEPLQGENVWHPLEPGEMVGVDWRMRLLRSHVDRVHLTVMQA
jgi:glutamine amidotransferase